MWKKKGVVLHGGRKQERRRPSLRLPSLALKQAGFQDRERKQLVIICSPRRRILSSRAAPRRRRGTPERRRHRRRLS